MLSEYRVDPETGDWHIVAPGRASRPVERSAAAPAGCPLCLGNEAMTPPEVLRIPAGEPAWRVRVVPNLYALVSPDQAPVHPVSPNGTRAAADGQAFPATGQHEVVVESPDHDGDLRSASTREVTEVLWALRERCRAMAARRPAAIVAFRNHGAAAGSSLHHPHSQIVALDQAPPGLVRRWDIARGYHRETGRRLHDDIAARERADGVRVVADGAGVLVYQPRAAGVPDETVVLPDDAGPDLANAPDEALRRVAEILPRVLTALAEVRDDPPYNLVVHAGPTGDPAAADWYRWHIGLYPRVTRPGGLEIATALSVTPTAPEQTAPLLSRRLHSVEPVDLAVVVGTETADKDNSPTTNARSTG